MQNNHFLLVKKFIKYRKGSSAAASRAGPLTHLKLVLNISRWREGRGEIYRDPFSKRSRNVQYRESFLLHLRYLSSRAPKLKHFETLLAPLSKRTRLRLIFISQRWVSQKPNFNFYAKVASSSFSNSNLWRQRRMSNPSTPGCDSPKNEFAQQGGITNGAAWYSVDGGMQVHFGGSRASLPPPISPPIFIRFSFNHFSAHFCPVSIFDLAS